MSVTVIDFMPPRGRNSDIVRLVRGDRGRVRMRTELILRFDYGRTVPWVTRLADGTMRAIAGPDMVTLHTPVRLLGKDLTTTGEFEVAAGDDGAVRPHPRILASAAARSDRSAVLSGKDRSASGPNGRRAAGPTANGRTP